MKINHVSLIVFYYYFIINDFRSCMPIFALNAVLCSSGSLAKRQLKVEAAAAAYMHVIYFIFRKRPMIGRRLK